VSSSTILLDFFVEWDAFEMRRVTVDLEKVLQETVGRALQSEI